MGMVGVGYPCRKIIFGESAAQTRHVLVRLFGRAAKSIQDVLDELFRSGMVDITRFEDRKDLNAPFDSHALMSALGIERGERFLDHFASVFNQREHLRRRRSDNDISMINYIAPR